MKKMMLMILAVQFGLLASSQIESLPIDCGALVKLGMDKIDSAKSVHNEPFSSQHWRQESVSIFYRKNHFAIISTNSTTCYYIEKVGSKYSVFSEVQLEYWVNSKGKVRKFQIFFPEGFAKFKVSYKEDTSTVKQVSEKDKYSLKPKTAVSIVRSVNRSHSILYM